MKRSHLKKQIRTLGPKPIFQCFSITLKKIGGGWMARLVSALHNGVKNNYITIYYVSSKSISYIIFGSLWILSDFSWSFKNELVVTCGADGAHVMKYRFKLPTNFRTQNLCWKKLSLAIIRVEKLYLHFIMIVTIRIPGEPIIWTLKISPDTDLCMF